jgi:hypothetical protein
MFPVSCNVRGEKLLLCHDSFVATCCKTMVRSVGRSSPRRASKKRRRRSSRRQRSYRSAAAHYRTQMSGSTWLADRIFQEHWQHMYDSTITATRFPENRTAPLHVSGTGAIVGPPTATMLPVDDTLLPLVLNNRVTPKRIHVSVVLADEDDNEIVVNVDARPYTASKALK